VSSDPDQIPSLIALYDRWTTTFEHLHPPPTHPYSRAQSGYSTMIQLYARSHQLDTALNLHSRLRQPQPWCRRGCNTLESAHHIFVTCPSFTHFRDEALTTLCNRIGVILASYHTRISQHPFLDSFITNPFSDSPVWPAHQTAYYLGLIPDIRNLLQLQHLSHLSNTQTERLLTRLTSAIHTNFIHLAGRIWGRMRCSNRQHAAPPAKTIPLPSILSHIRSSPLSKVAITYNF